MRHPVFAAMWLLAAGSAAAQQNGGFTLVSPLSLSAGRDSNFLVGHRDLDDTVYTLSAPRFALRKRTPRTDASIEYQPEFEFFSRYRDLNSWNHSAGLRLVHRASNRLTMEAGDSFLDTHDPSRSLVESFFRLPRSRFRENSVYGSLSYAASAMTSVGIRFDNTLTETSVQGLPGLGLFEGLTSAWTVDVSRVLTRRQRLGFAYSLLLIRPLGESERLFRDTRLTEPAHTASSTYVVEVNPKLAFSFSGGVIRQDRFSYSASAVVEKGIGNVRASLGYHRYLSFYGGLQPNLLPDPADRARFATGLLSRSVYEVATLKLAGKLTRRVGIDLLAMRPTSKLDPRERDIRGLVGRMRLDYHLTERLVLFSNAEYYGQNVNQIVGVPLSRKRYFGGIEVHLQRPPATPKEETGTDAPATASSTVPGGQIAYGK